jgi:hypothetical protein
MKISRNHDGDVLFVDDTGKTHLMHKCEGFDSFAMLMLWALARRSKTVETFLDEISAKKGGNP